MTVYTFLEKMFDRNPVTYKLLRKIQREDHKRESFVSLLCAMPAIPQYNREAAEMIRKIHENGHIFTLKERDVSFYLPDLNLEKGELIQNRIFLENDYFEITNLKNIQRFIHPGDVVLDIGANIGNHSLFFAKECEASKVYSFEPVPSTFKLLQKNVRLNHLENVIVEVNAALGKESGKADLIFSVDGDAGSNRVQASTQGNLSMKALDDCDIPEKVSFVKIDVEGYEYDVLQGATNFLKRNRPILFVEIFKHNFDHVNRLLTSLGYTMQMKTGTDYIYIA